MLLNTSNLTHLNRGFKTLFTGGLEGSETFYKKVATEVPSSTSVEDYPWLGAFPGMKKWVGDRVIKNLKQHGYTIANEEFEDTIAVPRPKIEDDTHGVFAPRFTAMGEAVGKFPDELVFGSVAAGFTSKCYDGQSFFDTDHPVINPATGAEVSVSNMQAGAGAPWFLLDTSKALKPFILQVRKRSEFIPQEDPTNMHTFMKNEFLYGAYARYGTGYGFWQMAFGSKATLDKDNFRAARTSMTSLKNDEGRPLAIKPNLMLVGPSNADRARDLILADRLENGATNTDRNLVEIYEVPWLV